jgi:hypothetical protein
MTDSSAPQQDLFLDRSANLRQNRVLHSALLSHAINNFWLLAGLEKSLTKPEHESGGKAEQRKASVP